MGLHQNSQGLRLLYEMSLKGKNIFTIEEVAEVAYLKNIPRSQLNKILSNLAAQGWLIRLRRGLYAGFGQLPGQIHTHPFAIATYLVQPSAISHWTALQYHGLTEQIPQIITASTVKKVITPSMRKTKTQNLERKHAWEIAGTHYEYTTIKKEHFYGIEKIWIDEYSCVPITDLERTLLDVFAYSKMLGGMGEAVGILENAISNIDIKKLINYTVRYNKKSISKRLGWVLEYFGISQDLLFPLLTIPTTSYFKLDPSRPAKGPYNKQWMIQNNLAEIRN